ncbi:hypothetical protein, partial [Salmonella enterica]|uniref:hypothetical protein n=1 Tax=Salmonella enterica TaxID=28901 RepID=UPI000AA04B74
TNLAAGTLAADSADASGGSQLVATSEYMSRSTPKITPIPTTTNHSATDIATNTTNINNLSKSVTTLTD